MWGESAWGEAPWGSLVVGDAAAASTPTVPVVGHLVGTVEAYALAGQVESFALVGERPTTTLPAMRVGG